MAQVRCFIALDLPSDVSRALGAVAKSLAPGLPSVRWVKPGSHHLTLRFLGDVGVDRLDDISRSIDRVCAGLSPIRIGLGALGGFPSSRGATVIWIGIRGDRGRANTLYGDLSDELASVGFRPDSRPFRPHLTLGRSRHPAPLPEKTVVPSVQAELASVSLIRSDLGKAGPRYTQLHTRCLEKCAE